MVDILSQIRETEMRLAALRTALRSRPEQEALVADQVEILICDVGDDRVAFLINSIAEVIPMPATSFIPEAPPWVTGMIDLRGELMVAIDVQARVTGQSRVARATDFVIVCQFEGRPVGLIVNRVRKAVRVFTGDFESPPNDTPMAPYIFEVVRVDGSVVLLLSIGQFIGFSDVDGKQ